MPETALDMRHTLMNLTKPLLYRDNKQGNKYINKNNFRHLAVIAVRRNKWKASKKICD